MQRLLPRFFRCFLIAALAAAVVVPLVPVGTAIGDSSEHPTLRVTPSVASTGQVITVTGRGFPARTALSELRFGRANALPVPAPTTHERGNFAVTLAVPRCPPGAPCEPEVAVNVYVKVGDIVGAASLTAILFPAPTIALSTDKASPGDTITISGSAFSPFANVDTINIGQMPALPTPNPLTDGAGDFSAAVVVPALNPGAYTITVRTGSSFTATAPITIRGATVSYAAPAEVVFSELTSRGLLTLAAAAPPGGVEFGAYVPGLPGETLTLMVPGDVLVLTLAKDARISVSSQPAVDVATDTTTFFTLGSDVSVKAIEVTVSPNVASTGDLVTIKGTGFPALTTLSEVLVDWANWTPVPPPMTDASGSITVQGVVPPCSPGASCLLAGSPFLVSVRVGDVVGLTTLGVPQPAITLSTESARPGDTITITGTVFAAYAEVEINIGMTNQAPTPNPFTNLVGDFRADMTVPALDRGAYTVTVRTGANFTATAPIRILSATVGSTVPAETAFQALTSRGLLTLAAAAPPGGTSFGAYVPGLPGDSLTHIEPEGLLILTLAKDARISVSGQSPVDVTAGTPTLFALGLDVFVEVIEHDP